MHPFYYRSTTNFGDAINGWLWQQLIGDLLNPGDGIRLVGIGTLIKSELEHVQGLKVIFGSGAGYGRIPDQSVVSKWVTFFVRGPLSCKALGMHPSLAVTDAAWLVGTLPEYRVSERRGGCLFIPHWTTATYGVWENICRIAGVEYVDPMGESREVLHRIRNAKLVIAEAMHGAIMADCFRIPWIPIVTSSTILSFKWHDWCQSVGLAYSPTRLPPSDLLDQMMHGEWPTGASPKIAQSLVETKGGHLLKGNAEQLGWAAKVKQQAKPALRDMRSKMLGVVRPMRNLWPASAWNQRRGEYLVQALQRIQDSRPYLSSDKKHAELMNKLSMKIQLLRDQYPALCARVH